MPKMTSPIMKIRRRPKRSPSRPPSSSRLPKARAYPVTTHRRLAVAMSRSFWMKGRAMFTMVPSSTTISWATEMSTSAQPRCRFWWLVGSATSVGALAVSVMRSCLSVGQGLVRRPGRAVAHGRQDHVVDDPGDGVVVGLEAHHEGAVQEDPGQRGADDLEVEVVVDLAALDRAVVDGAGDLDLGGDELLAEDRRELGVGHQGGDHGAEGVRRGALGDAVRAAEGGHQVTAQRAGVVVLDHRCLLGAHDGVDDQALLGVPAAVERGLAGARLAGRRRPWSAGRSRPRRAGVSVASRISSSRSPSTRGRVLAASCCGVMRASCSSPGCHLDETKRFRFISTLRATTDRCRTAFPVVQFFLAQRLQAQGACSGRRGDPVARRRRGRGGVGGQPGGRLAWAAASA